MKDSIKRTLQNINPLLIILVVILLAGNLTEEGWLLDRLLMLPGIIIGLTLHEAAHGFASYWLGDPTPKEQGRLSLNPLRHMDPVGFFALLLAGFGWGKPVQINPSYYKHRRLYEAIVSLAGVTANLIVALLSSLAVKAMLVNLYWSSALSETLFNVVFYIMLTNLVLMIFNLLPIPPLDGFSLLTQIFKLDRYQWYYPLYNSGSLILMLLIVFNVTDRVLTPALEFFVNLLI